MNAGKEGEGEDEGHDGPDLNPPHSKKEAWLTAQQTAIGVGARVKSTLAGRTLAQCSTT